MNDSVFRTRTKGAVVAGLPDQYENGKAARVWNQYIGGSASRTGVYKEWINQTLKKYGAQNVLDAACGTGVDSVLLLELGYQVWSIDASDKMLKYALKTRWERRKEPAFDGWEIEEGNWLSNPLSSDLNVPEGGFDAVLCLGNSFAHLPDFTKDQSTHRRAIVNFYDALKPGGILLIDHRNYDAILDTGKAPSKNIYYSGNRVRGLTTSVLRVDGEPSMITLDYSIDVSEACQGDEENDGIHQSSAKKRRVSRVRSTDSSGDGGAELEKFRLSYYPHRVKQFVQLLTSVFGEQTPRGVSGDYQAMSNLDAGSEVPNDVAYFIHWIQKSK